MALVALAACSGPTPKSPPATGTLWAEIVVPPPPGSPALSPARLDLFARLLPVAERFEPRSVPPQMLLSADRGNEVYVIARGAGGVTLGYLRDIAAPVIPGRTTDADLLDLTLVFDPALHLTRIVEHRPLLKRDGQPLTEADLRALLLLVDQPPTQLGAVPRPDDMVDGVTGATRQELEPFVVAGAAYSSRRLAGLTQDTRTIVLQAPLVWDRQRLQILVEPPATDATLAAALAELLPSLATLEVQRQVFQMMAHAYTQALRTAQPTNPAVEAALLTGLRDDPDRANQVAQACYHLARRGLRLPTVELCLKTVNVGKTVEPVLRARLAGTLYFLRGELAAALPELSKAVTAYDLDRDSELHLRHALALAHAGRRAEACAQAKQLFRRHSLLPEVDAALGACPGEIGTTVEQLRHELRDALLATRHTEERVAPTLSLEDDQLRSVDWLPASPGQITVLVVFSTWCPHCMAELPRVNEFCAALERQPAWRDRVRVVGMRTAVERERIPYAVFLAQLAPRFELLTDSAWSLAFTQLTRTLGLRAELPTLLVLDEAGVVRFVLESGDHRDTARELEWAVGALLTTKK